MKKNLRIVSAAAAAALLAVAPVAATAVVSAPTSTVQAATKEDTVATLSDIKPVGTTGDDASKANAFGTLTAADVKYAKETESAFTGSEAAKINAPTLKVNGIANPVEGKYVSRSVSLDGVPASDKKDVTVGSHVIKANYIYTLPEAASDNVAATIGGKAVIIPKGVKTIHVTFSKTVIMAAKDDTTTTSPSFNFGSSSIFDADANVGVNITAIAGWDGTTRLPGFGSFSGNITAAVNGQNYTALLHTDNANGVNVSVKDQKGNPVHSAHDLNTRTLYTATIKGVVFNLGSSMQGKSVTLQLPDNARFVPTAAQKSSVPNPGTFNGKADNNGVLTVPTIETDFYAMDPTDMKGLNFYSVKTG